MFIRRKERTERHFFCPKCHDFRAYNIQPASIGFTFYFLPIFEKRDILQFAVCQTCKKGFDPAVLDRSNQTLVKLAWSTKCKLSYSSPEVLKSKLASQGLKEDFIDTLIIMAQS